MDTTIQPQKTTTRIAPWAWVAAAGAVLALVLIAARLLVELNAFPENWNLGLREGLNEFKRWVVVNRNDHWLFIFFFKPLSGTIDFILRRAEDLLLWLPWPIIVLIVGGIANRISGLRLALLTTICLLLMGLFGLWEESMETLALMTIAVIISLAIGLPLGIWTARSDRAERLLRPVLDAMQTMPAFVYLIPVLLFFGIARVPSAIATVIYALPPAIRLTNLGIRAVPEEMLEAARAFGSTSRQILFKVQIPTAMPSIMAGVNQTIMMALSIVVIAALIGSGGLGIVVLQSLRQLRVGQALEAGLAIVVLAILLDRMSAALATAKTRSHKRQFQSFRFFSEKQRGNRLVETFEGGIDRLYNFYEATAYIISRRLSLFLPKQEPWFKKHRHPITAVLLLLPLLFILLLAGVQSFPGSWSVGLSRPVDALVQWMQINLYEIGETGLGTGPFRDFLIVRIFIPLGNFLTTQLPWVVIVLFFAAGAVGAGSWRLALLVIFGLLLIGLVGMWPFAMDTLSQTLVSVALCIVIGIPLGFWSAHNDQVEQVVRPILDFLQTIPIFVYLVPVIMLFGSGSVAGLIASVLYAIVPVVRLTNLGIRQVDKTILESAESFGSTSLQTLLKVEMPLALPSIMLGINQTIMMVLAMVIIAGLVGATGLGLEVVQGFTNDNLGRSVEAGLAIVLLAIVIDRITQAWAEKSAAAANI